ncbi:class A beta-lactamase, subclass A2 [Pedobacter sp. MR22-3]|uniref:class A beta-lactamase, subclass A2 n=1 Tax=Pedobacter sp. MR22-3 TaxID=2994552 RepID=UPI0022468ECB|nr:class A beta-lactamase, subclass A2 [Pedobacter sp. MR22-3]MCX2584413.1 class A beta-lactamase, subclass A2 [Pedobacter sp. MR22-3]
MLNKIIEGQSKFRIILLCFLILLTYQASAQNLDTLKHSINKILASKKAVVGISIIGNDGKDTLSLNGDRHFPLQSVFKFHIALATLSKIDKRQFSLSQKVRITKNELLPNLWSPLRDENPNGGMFQISTLIQYAVSQSDNVACDALLRLIGGPKVVEEYIKNNNIKDIAIKLNEEDIQKKWVLMFENWTTPKAASEVLKKFYNNKNKLLSEKSYGFIWKIMKETQTGEERIRGQLPKNAIVAHKTGSSGTNKEGITEAVNDIGIVFLPNGKYFIISAFVSRSKESNETNEKIIAEITKVTYDYYKGTQ